ncbi:MAG: COX15/CtaA family protein [Acidobacteriota bacterium]
MKTTAGYPRGIHYLATFLAAYVVLLITAGGLVKSLEAGLSVPDWPLSYGMVNPPRWWQIETVRAEHGHRLIAGVALVLTVCLVTWIARREPRAWVRRLGYVALGSVLAQALLGGITVLLYLPKPVSVAHAALAQLFLCLVVTLAVVTSRRWCRGPSGRVSDTKYRPLAWLAAITTSLIYLQILIGAVMRHAGAGLAIPDFPWVFGGLVPPSFDFAIGIHYAHRIGALFVVSCIVLTLARVLTLRGRSASMVIPAVSMLGIALVQATLGALVVLSGKAVAPNTLHVGTGALLLATSLVLTLECFRAAWLAGTTEERTVASIIEGLKPEGVTS